MMQALAEAAANDLERAILAADTMELRLLCRCAVGSIAAYVVACTEHDDASSEEPPFGGL